MTSLTSKGQINDMATLLVVPFALAIIFIVLNMTFSEVNDAWQNTSIVNNDSKNIMSDNEAKYTTILDQGFMMLFVGLIIAGIVGLFVLDTHPILFIVSAFAMIALFLVGGLLANSFSDATETGSILSFKNEFTFIPLIMENLFPTIIIVGGIFAVAFFGKLRLS